MVEYIKEVKWQNQKGKHSVKANSLKEEGGPEEGPHTTSLNQI